MYEETICLYMTPHCEVLKVARQHKGYLPLLRLGCVATLFQLQYNPNVTVALSQTRTRDGRNTSPMDIGRSDLILQTQIDDSLAWLSQGLSSCRILSCFIGRSITVAFGPMLNRQAGTWQYRHEERIRGTIKGGISDAVSGTYVHAVRAN